MCSVADRRGKAYPGVLSLVDLAGSERNLDSQYHNAARQKESAEINASLSVLKECIRIKSMMQRRVRSAFKFFVC